MATKELLKTCEQLEKLVTKCRISDTEEAKNYMACHACAMYIRYMCSRVPMGHNKSYVNSNRIRAIWFEIVEFYPGLEIDSDALDVVDRALNRPLNTSLNEGDKKRVYKLLEYLSDLAHNTIK